ncbi:MAG TPA: hypothetical protein PLW09_05475 [Candidatus Kapabacteria bacterium]|jgi:GNAT superfamily N-acetyltransferase|nr:hypothetical protein [Candidatus Kapabacteria bacterium]
MTSHGNSYTHDTMSKHVVSEKMDYDYMKPRELCYHTDEIVPDISLPDFIASSLQIIEQTIVEKNLIFRRASIADIEQLFAFIKTRYPLDIAEEISTYDIYRFITFGHGLVVQTQQGNIVACLFEVGYDTIDRTSYTLRLAVDPVLSGLNIGQALIEYSCLLAMKRGSKVKRGLLDLENFPSAHILINKVGWIAEAFYPNLAPLGTCFTICLPLHKRGFLQNRVNISALPHYISHKKEDKDYVVAPAHSIEYIHQAYKENFRVIAYIKKGILNNHDNFFLVPASTLYS